MFAGQLKNLRRSAGLTMEQLGQKLSVSKQTVSNWENDNIMPSVDAVVKVADLFSVSMDYLLGREKPTGDGVTCIDVTGLTETEIAHMQLLVDDLRHNKA